MPVRLDKDWRPLTEESVSRLAGQLGVFELGNDAGEILFIGFAGAKSLYGLKGEVSSYLGQASHFRIEITSAYRTRQRELLMVHHADHGNYPPMNDESSTRSLGKLSP